MHIGHLIIYHWYIEFIYIDDTGLDIGTHYWHWGHCTFNTLIHYGGCQISLSASEAFSFLGHISTDRGLCYADIIIIFIADDATLRYFRGWWWLWDISVALAIEILITLFIDIFFMTWCRLFSLFIGLLLYTPWCRWFSPLAVYTRLLSWWDIGHYQPLRLRQPLAIGLEMQRLTLLPFHQPRYTIDSFLTSDYSLFYLLPLSASILSTVTDTLISEPPHH